MIATRYLPAIAAILALALVPTVIHSYVGMTASDGRTTAAIAPLLDGSRGIDTGRSREWVRENFSAEDFVERRYGDVMLFVARSYDLKVLYHHPELGAAYGKSYDSTRLVRSSTPLGTVPVHVLTGVGGLACYVLLYDREFVEEPLLFHARQAFTMLFSPRQAMTLFFAHGRAADEPADSPVIRVVVGAVESFQTQPVVSR